MSSSAASRYLSEVPRPPPLPVFGNLFSMNRKALVQSMMTLARRYGPIFWLDMMGRPLVVVSGAHLVNELCDQTRFEKSIKGKLGDLRQISGDGLLTAATDEPNWRKARNILVPNFTRNAMRAYHPVMVEVAEQLIRKWDRLNAGDEIDVAHDMTSLTLETIGICGFDYRFNSFYRERDHPFIEARMRALDIIMRSRGWPWERLIYRRREQRLQSAIRTMNTLVDRIIKERKQNGVDLATKSDLLGHMLSGVDKTSGGQLDDVNIRYQIITFLSAGHETTSGLLTFAIYYLLRHPEVLAKCHDEVDRVLGRDLSQWPSYEQVHRLSYIAQVLKETLRLWPAAPAIAVKPIEDTVIGGRYRLRKDQHVVILLPMLHRDKAAWGERAESFDPENFSWEAEQSRPPSAYKPFGNGIRACIGQQFATHEATLVVAVILQRFNLLSVTSGDVLQIKENLTLKPQGLRLKVTQRERRDQPTARVPPLPPRLES